MSLYNEQSLFSLSVATGYASLASATTTRIYYTKPDGTTSYFTASVSGTSLTYSIQNGDIDQAGEWKFQAYIVVSGRIGKGEIASQYFETPLI